MQPFEFQGSFGDLPEKQPRLHLPKISLDSVLDLQKSESFVSRCQKRKWVVDITFSHSDRKEDVTATRQKECFQGEQQQVSQ